ncbi:hypothetical protein HRbin36_02585 [bacterium HR36]|nr:hypothetical protein HRbin36_02585 [bacterium HR36]
MEPPPCSVVGCQLIKQRVRHVWSVLLGSSGRGGVHIGARVLLARSPRAAALGHAFNCRRFFPFFAFPFCSARRVVIFPERTRRRLGRGVDSVVKFVLGRQTNTHASVCLLGSLVGSKFASCLARRINAGHSCRARCVIPNVRPWAIAHTLPKPRRANRCRSGVYTRSYVANVPIPMANVRACNQEQWADAHRP